MRIIQLQLFTKQYSPPSVFTTFRPSHFITSFQMYFSFKKVDIRFLYVYFHLTSSNYLRTTLFLIFQRFNYRFFNSFCSHVKCNTCISYSCRYPSVMLAIAIRICIFFVRQLMHFYHPYRLLITHIIRLVFIEVNNGCTSTEK